MSGINFSINLDDQQLRNALSSLIKRGEDLRPPFLEIGETMIQSHEQRFVEQTGPDGERWAPLSPAYQATKKKHSNMILVLNEYLANSFRYSADNDGLSFGTNIQYAALHHFGYQGPISVPQHTRRSRSGKATSVSAHTRQVNIPARPFIGISDNDETDIIDILSDYLVNNGDSNNI